MATTNKAHSGLDIMTQVEPIAKIKQFEKQVRNAIPTLTTPPVNNSQFKILKEKESNTRGLLVVYVPQSTSDPIQSNRDNQVLVDWQFGRAH